MPTDSIALEFAAAIFAESEIDLVDIIFTKKLHLIDQKFPKAKKTPLARAIDLNSFFLVKFLIEKGGNINLKLKDKKIRHSIDFSQELGPS